MRTILLAALLACIGAAPPQAKPVTINLGTLAPKGSAWHKILRDMAEEWKKATDGKVVFRIFGDGALGDEPDMVNKLGINQLQAAALTGVGLSEIAPEIFALQMPMLIQSYEELDYVLEKTSSTFEEILKKKGYRVLNWGDAGWVTFFAQQPVVSLDDLKKVKLFVWSSNAVEAGIWKDFGVQVVPLPATQILQALQTGMVNAFSTTPLAALSFQWFGLAKNMTELKWAPLVGATIIREETWAKIPADVQPVLLKAAKETGVRLRADTRKLGDDAVGEMKKRGLAVHAVPPAVLAEWEKTARSAYPKIMGQKIPAEILTAIEKARDEFRAKKKTP